MKKNIELHEIGKGNAIQIAIQLFSYFWEYNYL